MVPLVGNIFTICNNLITKGTIGKEIGANGKNGNINGTTNVTNQWYHWENPEHTHRYVFNNANNICPRASHATRKMAKVL